MRVNIALTGPAEIAKDVLFAAFPFEERQQVIRLGLAYAIRSDLQPQRGPDFGTPGHGQNLNVGSFDPDGDLRELVSALYPEHEDPYVVVETLMSLGLVSLAQALEEGQIHSISELLYAEEGNSDIR
jgi:hypothetical protein